ncbi:hypothetical protein D3C72_728620 [compost metagenome]
MNLIKPIKKVVFNLAQLACKLAPQRTKVLEGGRGLGKSTAVGMEMADVVEDMPRSKNFLIGETYKQILTLTLPSTISALERLGYIKDQHFFVGRRAPKAWKWPECYEPPLDYTHCIHFWTGTTYQLLSQDVMNRGINTCSGIGDESAWLDPVKLQQEVLATIRLEKNRFEKCRKYQNTFFVSSIPRTQQGKWLYSLEEEAKRNPDKVMYLRASSLINKENLPDDWFEIQRRSMTRLEYNIEILNIRPDKITGGFYPVFDSGLHTYIAYNNDYLAGLMDDGYSEDKFKEMDCRQDSDIILTEPLEIALDYGAHFNGIVTGQESFDPVWTFRTLSAMAVLQPELIHHVCEQWCNYYRFHQDRTVTFHYDHTAVGNYGNTTERYCDTVINILTKNGWTVIPNYFGQAPPHDRKYNFWGVALRNDHPNLPRFQLNRGNCHYLVKSICGAGVKQGRNGFEKDKRDEQKLQIDQRTTTHFSDAWDTLAFAKYGENISYQSISMPVMIG